MRLARDHGWDPSSGNDPLLHLDGRLCALEAELAAVDRALGIARGEISRYTGERALRIRTALDELDRHRMAARAVRDIR